MTQTKIRKAIVMVIVLIVLVPCAFLVYDALIASGEEKVEVYYMTSEGVMKPVKKDIRGENTEDIIVTTLHTLQEGITAEGMLPSVPDEIEFLSVGVVNNNAVIDISSGYHRLKNTEKVICRSALVWTLTSLDFIDGVVLTIEGQPLRNSSGEPFGSMNRSNMSIEPEISAETTEYAILTLYFANSSNTDLSTEERVIEVNANQTNEKTVLEQLIAGPEGLDVQRTVPFETKIRDVTTTKDGICYVNLSQEFVTKHTGGELAEKLTIYSIVNSLCELDHIDKVQFLIEGKKVDKFKEHLEIKTPFVAISSMKTVETETVTTQE
ncbi:MAG: GerMN domain-containing protein [Anaerotignum sp.]|nr:GerMN domain-containing protein [Anaerotignum sp.]